MVKDSLNLVAGLPTVARPRGERDSAHLIARVVIQLTNPVLDPGLSPPAPFDAREKYSFDPAEQKSNDGNA